MNFKVLRNVHLYSGCFFAPLLTIFILTGLWQTFDLHVSRKSGYKPPVVVSALSEVHTHQRFATKEFRPAPSPIFRYLMIAMSVGLLLNMTLGIMMALKFADPKFVWLAMIVGILVPVLMLGIPWINKVPR